MHEHDSYDELHAELASGEGMPEAHQQPRLDSTRKTFTPGAGTTSPDDAFD